MLGSREEVRSRGEILAVTLQRGTGDSPCSSLGMEGNCTEEGRREKREVNV